MIAEELKSDCRVRITEGSGIEVWSSVLPMYGEAIERLASECWNSFGKPACRIEMEDGGALPCIQRARLEAALARFTGSPLPPGPRRAARPQKLRRRRTRLYIPGDAPRLFMNSSLSGADMVIFDLEDAVSASAKDDARAIVRHAAPTLDWGQAELAVRINSGEEGLADLEATAAAGIDLYLLPKIEIADEVRRIESTLERLGSPALLMPLVESALGVENALAITQASPRIAAISLGLEDLILDLGAQRTPGQAETAFARGRLVNAARAAGVQPLASVFPRFESPEEVAAYALSARQMGFEGIGCIHPSQIRPAHLALAPTAEELAWARKVADQWQAEGGAAAIEGAMIDAPVHRRALQTLRQGGAE